jgi:osmotically-inducible protein OsmY
MKFLPNASDSVIRTVGILVGGLGLGAALMYVLDPERGKRRRAVVRDKALSGARRAGNRVAAKSRDAANRVRGAAAEVKSLTRSDEADDFVLEERVRAAIGRVVARPPSIDVAAIAGTVLLSGAVRTDELDDLLSAVRGVPGVADVENRLEMYETSEDVEKRPANDEKRGVDRWEPVEADS